MFRRIALLSSLIACGSVPPDDITPRDTDFSLSPDGQVLYTGPVTTIVGTAWCGSPVLNAVVTAHAFDAPEGGVGPALATSGTNAEGDFQLELPAHYQGRVLVRVGGGGATYLDPATERLASFANSHALVSHVEVSPASAPRFTAVTPLTTLAVAWARSQGNDLGRSLERSSGLFSQHVASSTFEIWTTSSYGAHVVDVWPAPTTSVTLFTTGLAQLAQQQGTSLTELLAALEADISDGQFTGTSSGTQLAAGVPLDVETSRGRLAAAAVRWLEARPDAGTLTAEALGLDDGFATIVSTDASVLYPALSPPMRFDERAPVVDFASPPAGTPVNSDILVSILATDNVGVTSLSFDGAAASAPVLEHTVSLEGRAEGLLRLDAVALDAAGNEGRATLELLVDRVAPEVAPPKGEAVINDAWYNATVSVKDAGSGVFSVSLSAKESTTPVARVGDLYSVHAELAEGANLLRLEAVDRAGNASFHEWTVIRDSIAPELKLLSPTDGAFVGPGPFTAQISADADSVWLTTHDGQLVGTAMGESPIWSFVVTAPPLDGPFSGAFGAEDAAGNVTTLPVQWIRDGESPVIHVVQALPSVMVDSLTSWVPAGPVTARITAADSQSGVSSVCASGGACTFSLPWEIPLPASAAGALTFVATDGVGNVGQVTAVLKRDATAPACALLLDGNSPTNAASATLKLSATDEGVGGIVATIVPPDGSPVEMSAGTATLPLPLVDGPYAVGLECRDALGNTAASTSTVILVDRTPPSLEVLYPADQQWVGPEPLHVVVSTSDPSKVAAITVAVDEAPEAPLGPGPAVFESSHGVHGLRVTSHDKAGNATTVFQTFRQDLLPPVVEAVGGAGAVVVGDNLWVSGESIALSVTPTDEGSGVASVCASGVCTAEVSVGGVYWLDLSVTGGTVVEVEATDHVGLVGSASRTVQRDSDGPSCQLGALPVVVNGFELQVEVDSTDAGVGGGSVDVAGVALIEGEPGLFTGTLQLPADDATLAVSAICRDALGNQQSAPVQVVVVDRTPPDVKVEAPSAGTWLGPGVFALSVAGSGAPVAVEASFDHEEWTALTEGSLWTATLVPPPGVEDVVVWIRARDAAGNQSEPVGHPLRVDSTPPVIAEIKVNGAACLAGVCYVQSSPATVTVTAGDAHSGTALIRSPGAGSASMASGVAALTFNALSAPSSFDVIVEDNAGNSAAGTVTLAVDDLPPTCSLSAPTDGALVKSAALTTSVKATDAGSQGITVAVRVDAQVAPLGGGPATFSGLIPLPATDGPVTVHAECTDAVGNSASSAPAIVTIDRTPPAVAVLWPEQDAWFSGTSVMKFTANEELKSTTLEVNGVKIGQFSLIDGVWTASMQLPPSTQELRYTAVDLASNETRVTRRVHYDPSIPVIKGVVPYSSTLAPSGIYWTTNTTVNVRVTAEDPQGNLASVCVKGTASCVAVSGASALAVLPVTVPSPPAAVTFVAKDTSGASSEFAIQLRRDITAPTCTMSSTKPWFATRTPSVAIGSTDGDSGPRSAEVTATPEAAGTSKTATISSHDGAKFTGAASLANVDGYHALTVTCKDYAGNTASAQGGLYSDTTLPVVKQLQTTVSDDRFAKFSYSGALPTYDISTSPTVYFSQTACGPGCPPVGLFLPRMVKAGINNGLTVKFEVAEVQMLASTRYRFRSGVVAFPWRTVPVEPVGHWVVPVAGADFVDNQGTVSTSWPDALEFEATDAAGNVGSRRVDFEVVPLMPPPLVTAVTLDVSPPNIPSLLSVAAGHLPFGPTTGGNVAAAPFVLHGGIRVLAFKVQNVFDVDMSVVPEGEGAFDIVRIAQWSVAGGDQIQPCTQSVANCAVGSCTTGGTCWAPDDQTYHTMSVPLQQGMRQSLQPDAPSLEKLPSGAYVLHAGATAYLGVVAKTVDTCGVMAGMFGGEPSLHLPSLPLGCPFAQPLGSLALCKGSQGSSCVQYRVSAGSLIEAMVVRGSEAGNRVNLSLRPGAIGLPTTADIVWSSKEEVLWLGTLKP